MSTTKTNDANQLADGDKLFDDSSRTMHIHQVPGSRIARGAFGEISLALAATSARKTQSITQPEQADNLQNNNELTTSLSIVALKTVFVAESSSSDDDDDETSVLDEITCLRELHPHPNIVPLLNVMKDTGEAPGFQSLVLPYCPMDLHSVMEWKRQSFHPPLSMGVIRCLALHLFRALQHVHQHNIVHGDIKPSNLLLNIVTGQLQLADFGISQRVRRSDNAVQAPVSSSQGDSSLATDAIEPDPEDMAAMWALKIQQSKAAKPKKPAAICTLQYRPPELLLGSQSTEPSLDMFSAGVTVADWVKGSLTFPGTNDLSQLSLYFQALGTPLPGSQLHQMPDWGKLTFTEQLANPLWYKSSVFGNRGTPINGSYSVPSWLSKILSKTIHLEPQQRWTPSECCTAIIIDDHASGREQIHQKDIPLRPSFLQELLPSSLQSTPLLLAPHNNNYSAVEKQIQKLANHRRTFLSSLEPWNQFLVQEKQQASFNGA